MFPDGSSRKRRNGHDTKARWYSYYRMIRFCRHYGFPIPTTKSEFSQILAIMLGKETKDDK